MQRSRAAGCAGRREGKGVVMMQRMCIRTLHGAYLAQPVTQTMNKRHDAIFSVGKFSTLLIEFLLHFTLCSSAAPGVLVPCAGMVGGFQY
jgi:hypothetical protein